MKLSSLTPGSLVVISLHSPREKYWGVLSCILPAGVIVRGLALDVFEEFVRQEQRGAERMIGATTIFFPMARVERLEGDETVGPVVSFGGRFSAAVGRPARSVLVGRRYLSSGSATGSTASSARGSTGARKVGTRR